tara:strand:- start:690 stop:2201 length:1512 start_codon:yes stop_codon:yes gene_type:complete
MQNMNPMNGYIKYKKKYLDLKGGSSSVYKMLTPATFFNFFDKNIMIINTLDNPYFVTKKPFDEKYVSLFKTKDEFKEGLNLDSVELLVFYCANYTCSAAKNYISMIESKLSEIDKKKIILYEGGLYEWSNLSLNYEEFGIYNSKTNKLVDDDELYNINKDYAHFLESKKTGYPQIVYDNVGSENFYKNLTENNLQYLSNSGRLLDGKVCVVTGATSGLGLETLKRMLDFGAKHVTGTYFNNDERANKVRIMLEKTYGESKVKIIKADARTETGNLTTFDPKKREEYLPNDLVAVNCADINAGIYGPANIFKKHVFNINDEDYDKVMDLNLRGYYLGVKHFSKQAMSNNVRDGSIVCIKSIYGSTGSLFSNIAYQVSKHGTMGLVRQSAVEMARPNEKVGLKFPIRVNAVSPTFSDTALTRPFLNYKKVFDTIANSNTTGQLAKKEDVANAVVFLCSEFSGSITGVDLPVDCGVLAESVPTYPEVRILNDEGIDELSCCGEVLK